jgi:outer membrane protein assembly factor BamA
VISRISFESLKSSSMKTALNYSIMHNRLDDPIAPTKGYFLSVSNVCFILMYSPRLF